MRDLFGEVIVDEIPNRIGKPPMAKTIWQVATWYSPAEKWKIWPDQWLTRFAADLRATKTIACIRGHTHYVILEIKLPGESAEVKP